MKIKQEQKFKKPFIDFTARFYNNTLKENTFKIKQFLKLLYVYNKKNKKIFLLDISKTADKKLFNVLKPLKNVTVSTSLPKNDKNVVDEIVNQELFVLYTTGLSTKNEINTMSYVEEKLNMFKIPFFIVIGGDTKQIKPSVAEHYEQKLEGCFRLNSSSLLTIFN